MLRFSTVSLKNVLGVVLVLLSCAWLFALPLLPLSGNKAVSAELLPVNQGDYALVFFGYPGCNQICPDTLRVLSTVQAAVPTLEIVFVNLDWHLTAHTSLAYAQHFDGDFLVYHLEPQALTTLLDAFGVSFSRTANQLVSHSDYVYLLEKDLPYWRIRHIYRNPAKPSEIQTDLQKLRQGAA